MKLAIVLFGHGQVQSPGNILCGWLNLPLNENGIKDAQELSEKLKKERVDVAFCSDMLRSKQALVEVLRHHPKAKVLIDHRLRGRHFGSLSGSLEDALRKNPTKEYANARRDYYFVVPGGESLQHVGKRVFPFMTQLLRLMQEERVNVAISAHRASLRLIQEYLEGLHPYHAGLVEHRPADYKKYVVEFG